MLPSQNQCKIPYNMSLLTGFRYMLIKVCIGNLTMFVDKRQMNWYVHRRLPINNVIVLHFQSFSTARLKYIFWYSRGNWKAYTSSMQIHLNNSRCCRHYVTGIWVRPLAFFWDAFTQPCNNVNGSSAKRQLLHPNSYMVGITYFGTKVYAGLTTVKSLIQDAL